MKTAQTKNKMQKWYTAKTLYLNEVIGKEKVRQKADKSFNLFEERIVLIKASSFNDAMRKAEKEAKAYQSSYTNPYKQKVKVCYLGCIDVFELFSEPTDLSEVYSTTNLVNKRATAKKVLDCNFGEELDEQKEIKIRSKYLNIEFSHFKESSDKDKN